MPWENIEKQISNYPEKELKPKLKIKLYNFYNLGGNELKVKLDVSHQVIIELVIMQMALRSRTQAF